MILENTDTDSESQFICSYTFAALDKLLEMYFSSPGGGAVPHHQQTIKEESP